MTATLSTASTTHETAIAEAPNLYGDVAYRATCSCSWAERSWHHADDYAGPDAPGQAASAALTAAATHVRDSQVAAAWTERQAASYRSRS